MGLKKNLYIGLMSGTSLDGVDAALIALNTESEYNDRINKPLLEVLAFESIDFPLPLRENLMALNETGDNELHRSAIAANALSVLYAQAVQKVLNVSAHSSQDIVAIGSHGQTVRHQPQLFDGTGYTVQLQNPALLAELSGITVVADFRSRDIAAGGQGAPLVPAFHEALLKPLPIDKARCVLVNIGGIANISAFTPYTHGFDCGPGNALMDYWCYQHTASLYDKDGQWAATGQVIAPLLESMLTEPYFAKPTPKSTGRDLFNPIWLEQQLTRYTAQQGLSPKELKPQDVQATLLMLTAKSIVKSLDFSYDLYKNFNKNAHGNVKNPEDAQQYSDDDPSKFLFKRMFVCGGGAGNVHLMKTLQTLIPQITVQDTRALGVSPQQMESCAFAWLAAQTVKNKTANLPEVTGAKGPRILGAIYSK